jgi:hypothetical protein
MLAMKRTQILATILLICGSLVLVQCGTKFAAPPASLQQSDLAGTWEADYLGPGVDTLIIREDGTFKQIYHSTKAEDYTYETSWNEWSLEPFRDGRVWLHLPGARYYIDGIGFAEQEGLHAPCPDYWPDCRMGAEPPAFGFYDPYGKEFVEMVGELILNVRSRSSGAIVLQHMWATSDQGFTLIGGGQEFFRRVKVP